VVIGRTS